MPATFTCAVGFFVLTCSAPDIAPPPAARFCKAARPILMSRQDTAETQRQVRGHNAALRAACGGR